MLAHELLSLLAVVSRDGTKQFAVRLLDDLGSPRKLNGHAPITEDATVNHREHFRKRCAVSELVYRPMKAVCVDHRRIVASLSAHSAVGVIEELLHLRDLGFCGALCGQVRSYPFQSPSDAIDIVRVIKRDRGNVNSATRPYLDETILLQTPDRLADRIATDAQRGGDLHLKKPLPKLKFTRHERISQRTIGAFL